MLRSISAWSSGFFGYRTAKLLIKTSAGFAKVEILIPIERKYAEDSLASPWYTMFPSCININLSNSLKASELG